MLNRKVEGGALTPVYLANAQITADGELWTTVTERENDVFVSYSETGIAATKYIVLVDRNGVAYPHNIQAQGQDRLDITSIYYALELSVNASILFSYGVITRIDGTNADIQYFTAIPKLTGANQADEIVSLRGVPSQVKLDFNASGVLQHGLTNLAETNVAGVNTGTALSSPEGTTLPGLGDFIVKVTVSGGSCTFGTFIFYHGHPE